MIADAESERFAVPAEATRERSACDPNWHIPDVGADSAVSQGITGKGILIGFADTGIEPSHSAFAGKAVHFAEFDDTGALTARPAYDSSSSWHGTRVAAIAAGAVTVGVAPNAEIAMASVLPSRSGSVAQVLAGLNWLATIPRSDNGAGVDLLNLSLVTVDQFGRAKYSPAYKPIISFLQGRGMIILAAIGNDGTPRHGSPGNYSDAIGVGAVDRAGHLWPNCCHGIVPQEGNIAKPDYVTAGVDVWSPAPGGGYNPRSGASFATPVATGLAALLAESAGLPSVSLELRNRAVPYD
jgi:bacillopeptidase F